jgi:hypothetical protein
LRKHHLAGGDRHVDADLEPARVGLAQLELALAGLDVLGQHPHAAHEVRAAFLDGLSDELRIGGEEVRRRERARDLLHIEAGLVPRVLVDALGVVHHVLGPPGGDQVGLLQEIEDRILGPVRILEAAILRLGLRDRLHLFALHALEGRGP